MRFKLSLLAAIPLALCAAEKPFSAPTGYFTPECLASFPQAENIETPLTKRKSEQMSANNFFIPNPPVSPFRSPALLRHNAVPH